MGKNSRNRNKNAGRANQPKPATPTKPAQETAKSAQATTSPSAAVDRPQPRAKLHEKPRLTAEPARLDEALGYSHSPISLAAIKAIFGRNYSSYFSNPAGYVFITLFVLLSAGLAFWQPVFFANNLASLAPLNQMMPYLLLFFIPAITMSAWAEERRLGTDELILTLPARDSDVVLGKFLAAVGIYTTALLFSLSLIGILYTLGKPDPGVIFATYIGYWLMGVAMIAIGLVASVVSSNITVAFILGALFCGIPVFTWVFAPVFPVDWKNAIESLSIPNKFNETFAVGVIPLDGVFYFLSLAGVMIYVNVVLLGRRHWVGGERTVELWTHSILRIAAVVVAFAAADVLIGRVPVRADMSVEGLHSLSKESLRLVREIPADRQVYVEAYFSENVPRDYVQVRDDLLNKLREFAAESQGRIRLNLIPTELYSSEAREAEKKFNIMPRRVAEIDDAKQGSAEIFLGVAFTSGADEVVVPFFDRGLPVEYELARSVRVVSKTRRKKLGVLQTDAKLLGGFDFRAMSQGTEWPLVSELKKQYEVSSISPDTPIPADLDVLLVAQPSSLNQRQVDNVTAHVKAGRPTMLLVDPFPAVNLQIAPEVPKQSQNPQGGAPPEQKGDLTPLMDLLGVEWPQTEIVFNYYNPHKQFADMRPEIVFIGEPGAGMEPFNSKEAATSSLQDLVAIYPGHLRPRGNGTTFTPLLRTSPSGGIVRWSDMVKPGMMGGMTMDPNFARRKTGLEYVLAARISGKPNATLPKPTDAATKAEPPETPVAIQAVVIADLDLISESFFEMRARKIESLEFDNVTFVLNCVDVLAGDDSYIELRKRRIKQRTLTRLEEETKIFVDDLQAGVKNAEDEAKDELDKARKRLEEKMDALRKRTDLDERTKEIKLAQDEEVETRRLKVDTANIEDAKRRKLAESKADMEMNIRKIQRRVRLQALLTPIPAVFLGMIVFAIRLGRENRGANPNRLA
jgi:ABC-2 type transport system permease protein